jgi:hypothetical protein
MKLLFLHGAPAVGKRTVGEAVVSLVPGRLFDNHAAVDFARTLFDFDGPGFWELVHSARLLALEKAAEHGVPLVVQTSCYSHPVDLSRLEDFERVLARHGGELLPVYLTCSRETLDRRVGAADRRARRKVITQRGSRRLLLSLEPGTRSPCQLPHHQHRDRHPRRGGGRDRGPLSTGGIGRRVR